ncbi:hypothetical protein [Sphingobium yanoikuyae]|uniref:hypothetical protein n=1 Tax=Sphingobium yanoikuyae TaxID=13690 RepID=UPI0028B03D31|nr:hypothetical protein [Sphingobium yanoikuyae]
MIVKADPHNLFRRLHGASKVSCFWSCVDQAARHARSQFFLLKASSSALLGAEQLVVRVKHAE